jgi:mRNA interferase MazF
MGTPTVGSVVIVRFPFSDLSNSKKRPAVIVANAGRGDWILCQITSNPYADPNAIQLDSSDFLNGGLQIRSFVRPAKLFTANESLFLGIAGILWDNKTETIRSQIITLLSS